MDVVGRTFGFDQNKIGVPLADDRAADTGSFQTGVVDQIRSAVPRGVFKEASRPLLAERLVLFAQNPDLLKAAG